MRFRQAHKASTYAVVLSAFLAVSFSGLLHPLLVLLSTLAIAGSWYWEPPRVRYERWEIAWTVLAVLVFIYQTLSVLAGSEIIIAGSNFLLFLLLVKLFNRSESKDYLHIYVLSFLLLTAGTVLNAEISYGFFFLCYVVSSTWALTILHLRRELENNFLLRHSSNDDSERIRVERVMNSKRIVGRKFFIGTGLVSLGVFAGALSLFLLFPRIGFGLFFDKGRGGVTMAGFSDGVQLGGHGLIKKDSTVVMRAKVDKKYQGRKAPALHWRGVAFDRYSKGEWRRSRWAPSTKARMNIANGKTSHVLRYDMGRAERQARRDLRMMQDIYLEPVGYDVLFGASLPLAFVFDTKFKSQTHKGQNDELRHPHAAGIRYTVYSDPTPPSASLLRGAHEELPAGFEVYLQLPEEIPECPPPRASDRDLSQLDPRCRVRDLARLITKDAHTRYDKALAIETWLRANLDYTLEMKSPGDTEPVEFFLFDRQRGHCEYFSSAMSILARSVGIPIRNVNGFLGGEWNEYDDYIAVRAGDAHSWVEVYLGNYGWVTFDPTPGGESDLLGRGTSGFLDRMRRIADTVRFKWFKWVIEYDLYQQLKLFKGIGKSLKGSANKYFKTPLRDAKAWAKKHRKKAAAIVVFVGLVVLMVSLRRRRRHGTPYRNRPTSKRQRDPVVTHYLAASRLLKKRGYRRADATTPREFAGRLGEAAVPGATAYAQLTEIYYRSEYGKAVRHDAQAALELRRQMQDALRKSKTKRRGAAAI